MCCFFFFFRHISSLFRKRDGSPGGPDGKKMDERASSYDVSGMQMKRFGATISEEEEEEEVVHIPSPYKVKPRSKNFFCFPPFAFIGVRS